MFVGTFLLNRLEPGRSRIVYVRTPIVVSRIYIYMPSSMLYKIIDNLGWINNKQ